LDEKLFVRRQNALMLKDAREMFSNVPTLEVKPVDENEGQYICASDIEQIKSYQLDILVKMGFGNLRGDVLSAATYGVWSYRWGDPRKIEDGLTGFWEVANQCPETGAALQQLGFDGKHHRILFETWYFTYPFSPARSRNYILWAASSFLPRQVERLHRLGKEQYFYELPCRVDEIQTSLKRNSPPSNLVVLRIVVRLIGRILLEVYRRRFDREQWELLLRFNQQNRQDSADFIKLSPPKDYFWADPHVIRKDSRYYVFFEEYSYQARKGHISVLELDLNGKYKQPIPVLQKDYHLSFPFVFYWMGRYYMVPESAENSTIDLYECTRFPDQWQHKITLMKDVKAVDSTLLYCQGKWWLFTAMSEQEQAAPQVELFLFYSEELFTDRWQAHPMNPIVSDVKRARAAGGIFVKDGVIFRPSQDCSNGYGYGFDLNEIVTLSDTEYCERTMVSVRPDQLGKVTATHSYASEGNLTVIDALTRQSIWAKFA
jgi:hypothetical protein